MTIDARQKLKRSQSLPTYRRCQSSFLARSNGEDTSIPIFTNTMKTARTIVVGISTLGGPVPDLSIITQVIRTLSRNECCKYLLLHPTNAIESSTSCDSLQSLSEAWYKTKTHTSSQYSASFVATVQQLVPLLANKSLSQLIICATASRSKLSPLALRWVDSLASQCKLTLVKLLWVDTSTAPASQVTFGFGRSIPLVPLSLLCIASSTIPTEAMRMSSCPSTVESTLLWPCTTIDSSRNRSFDAIPLFSTIVGRHQQITAQFCLTFADFSWKLLTAPMSLSGWLVLRRSCTDIVSLMQQRFVVIARFGKRWVALQALTPLLIMVYVLSEDDTPPILFDSLKQYELPFQKNNVDESWSCTDPLEPFSPHVSLLSDSATKQTYLKQLLSKDIAEASKRVVSECNNESVQPFEAPILLTSSNINDEVKTLEVAVNTWYLMLIEDSGDSLVNASRRMRVIERMYRKSVSVRARKVVQKSIASILRSFVICPSTLLKPADDCLLPHHIALQKAQLVCHIEYQRLDGAVDPLPQRVVITLRRILAALSTTHSRTLKRFLHNFLDSVLYKQYGRIFQKSLCTLYEYFDIDPPAALLDSPKSPTTISLTMVETPTVPLKVNGSGFENNSFQNSSFSADNRKLVSTTLSNIQRNNNTSGHRLSLSCRLTASSHLRHAQVKWTRSKRICTKLLSDRLQSSQNKQQFSTIKKSKQSKRAGKIMGTNNVCIDSQSSLLRSPIFKSSVHSFQSPQPQSNSDILIAESPARSIIKQRLCFTPSQTARFRSLGLMMNASPDSACRTSAMTLNSSTCSSLCFDMSDEDNELQDKPRKHRAALSQNSAIRSLFNAAPSIASNSELMKNR